MKGESLCCSASNASEMATPDDERCSRIYECMKAESRISRYHRTLSILLFVGGGSRLLMVNKSSHAPLVVGL